ncbi:MAG: ABC transporter substrate-binding protein [Firmicutes bacterium]|jgi:peptide/nickel transport system substrate-binding protein|nr:ABC transporter substrate-binding protein [Bacillota bacterium]
MLKHHLKTGLRTTLFSAALAAVAFGSVALAAPTKPSKPLVVVSGPSGIFEENFNPFGHALVGTEGLIYQPLFFFNPYTSKVQPILGTSYAWSQHDTVLTVNLRHGVRWSNGKPFTASDVVFSFNYRRKYPALDTTGVWTLLSNVRQSGQYTVVFTFKKAEVPMAWYVLGQTAIIPKTVWTSITDPTKVLNLDPIGTGPYVVHSFNPEEYTYSVNRFYWGGKPRVSEIEFPAYSSNTSIAGALAQGKIDWASIFIPNIRRVYVSADPRTNHYSFEVSSTLMLYTNLHNSLLAQLPVREAMSLAINRQKINAADYYYAPTANRYDLLLPNEKNWLPPIMAKHAALAYNPTAAESILKKAGYHKNSAGIFVSPKGQPLQFTLQVVSTYSEWVAMSSILASELKQVGIGVTVQGESADLYDSNVLTQHRYQLALSWTDNGPTPFYAYNAMLNPQETTDLEGWANPATTHWLNVYSTSNQGPTHRQAIAALAGLVAKDLPSIPLVETPTWFEYRTQYFRGFPSAANPYAQGGPWLSPSNGLIATHLTPIN